MSTPHRDLINKLHPLSAPRCILDPNGHAMGECIAEPLSANGHPMAGNHHNICRVQICALALPGGEGLGIAAQVCEEGHFIPKMTERDLRFIGSGNFDCHFGTALSPRSLTRRRPQ